MRLDTDICAARFLMMQAAAATTPVKGRLPLALRRHVRVLSSVYERYAVLSPQVVVIGADPYVGLFAACLAARRGSEVLLALNAGACEWTNLARPNVERALLMPPVAAGFVLDSLKEVGRRDYQGALEALMAAALRAVGPDGRPMIRLLVGNTLSPDDGASVMAPGQHVLWPRPSVSIESPERAALEQLFGFLRRRLWTVRLPPRNFMTLPVVLTGAVVTTSPLPDFRAVSWRCRHLSLAGAQNPLGPGDTFDHACRVNDFVDTARAIEWLHGGPPGVRRA